MDWSLIVWNTVTKNALISDDHVCVCTFSAFDFLYCPSKKCSLIVFEVIVALAAY